MRPEEESKSALPKPDHAPTSSRQVCWERHWKWERAGCKWPCARAPAEVPCLLAQHELGLVLPDTALAGARQSANQSALAQLPAFSAGHSHLATPPDDSPGYWAS